VDLLLHKLLLAGISLLAFWLLRRTSDKLITRLGKDKLLLAQRVNYVRRCVTLLELFVLALALILIIGIGYTEVTLFVSSVFTVIGVALFAQWSMLSNLTASLIIFFAFPYRVGDRVKVVDKDDDISGIIEEIAAFHVLIRRPSGDLVTYPNSLILQKAVIKLTAETAPASGVPKDSALNDQAPENQASENQTSKDLPAESKAPKSDTPQSDTLNRSPGA